MKTKSDDNTELASVINYKVPLLISWGLLIMLILCAALFTMAITSKKTLLMRVPVNLSNVRSDNVCLELNVGMGDAKKVKFNYEKFKNAKLVIRSAQCPLFISKGDGGNCFRIRESDEPLLLANTTATVYLEWETEISDVIASMFKL